MKTISILPAIFGLLLLVFVVLAMLVYANYIGFGEYQQYSQIINFAAIAGVMIVIIRIGSVVASLSSNKTKKNSPESQNAQKVYNLERDLAQSSQDYHRIMANAEDYHIITGRRGGKKQHSKNHMEQLKERSMFDDTASEDLD